MRRHVERELPGGGTRRHADAEEHAEPVGARRRAVVNAWHPASGPACRAAARDKRSDRSIEHQVRLCRENVAADGHEVTEVYSDYATPGDAASGGRLYPALRVTSQPQVSPPLERSVDAPPKATPRLVGEIREEQRVYGARQADVNVPERGATFIAEMTPERAMMAASVLQHRHLETLIASVPMLHRAGLAPTGSSISRPRKSQVAIDQPARGRRGPP